MVDGLQCDRCGGGRGPWDFYAEGILLCSECRENVPDKVRYAPRSWPQATQARARNPAPAAAGHETPSEAADGI